MLQLSPSDFVLINLQKKEGLLTLNNVSQSPVAFKVQTSSPKLFLVTPSSGLILPGSSSTLKIGLNSADEIASKAHRFLIKAKAASDVNSIDWKSPDIKDYKISAKIFSETDTVEEKKSEKLEKQEKPEEPDNQTKFKSQLFKTNIVKNFLLVDNQKDSEFGRKSLGDIRYSKENEDNTTKNLVAKYNELSSIVDQLKSDLEVVRNKQKFSIELDQLTKESVGSYSLVHIIGVLVLSFFIGLYLN